jgi:hypothetical protein
MSIEYANKTIKGMINACRMTFEQKEKKNFELNNSSSINRFLIISVTVKEVSFIILTLKKEQPSQCSHQSVNI